MPRKAGTGKYPKSLTFSVDEKTFNDLNSLAESKNIPASEILREALVEKLATKKEKSK